MAYLNSTTFLFLIVTLLIDTTAALELKNRQSNINAVDPFDHSWIEQWASLGDSYSVGLGSGHAIKSSANVELNTGGFFAGYCYQFSEGYANLMNSDEILGIQPNRKFQYLGCSGALAPNILSDQVKLLKSPQMITLSAGGNDAGLASILNWCVYQWMAPSILGSCDGVLQDSENTINGDDYTKSLTDLINAIKAKMSHSSNRIYWIGYNKFFDVSDGGCDDVTWALKRLANKQYLTKDRRQRMNDLVDLVNAKIKAVVAAAGDQVVFVDWEADTEKIKGRYCEPGVDEHWEDSQGFGADREQTVFYEWGTTKDDDEDSEKGVDELRRRQESAAALNTPAANATFEGAIANYVNEGKLKYPDVYANATGDLGFNITGSWLPDAYGRVFHVTKYGNSIIAKNVINAITQEQAKLMNQPAITTTIGCSAAAQTSSAPQETLKCHGISGNKWIVSRDIAAQNAADFCKQSSNSVEYNQNTGNDLRLSLSNTNQPSAPISSAPGCVDKFVNVLLDSCDGNDPINNWQNYKYGGTYTSAAGWTFLIEALNIQTDDDSCDVSYQFWDDFFEIRGENFPDAKMGQDGAGLLEQLKGCGDVTKWSFELTPNDTKYQWYAHGKLPIGTKACTGRALLSAGGSTAANCHGAG